MPLPKFNPSPRNVAYVVSSFCIGAFFVRAGLFGFVKTPHMLTAAIWLVMGVGLLYATQLYVPDSWSRVKLR